MESLVLFFCCCFRVEHYYLKSIQVDGIVFVLKWEEIFEEVSYISGIFFYSFLFCQQKKVASVSGSSSLWLKFLEKMNFCICFFISITGVLFIIFFLWCDPALLTLRIIFIFDIIGLVYRLLEFVFQVLLCGNSASFSWHLFEIFAFICFVFFLSIFSFSMILAYSKKRQGPFLVHNFSCRLWMLVSCKISLIVFDCI